MVLPRLLTVVMVVVMVIATGHGQSSQTSPERQRLREHLLQNYSKETIPGPHKDPLIVTMSSLLIRNLEMHAETHRLQLHAWIGFMWTDNRLAWNSNDYDGLTGLTFSPRDLWLPDLSFYNAAAAKDIPIEVMNRLVVTPDGGVLLIMPFDMPFSCDANLRYWPDDTHDCLLKIGSWTHSGYIIDLRVKEGLAPQINNDTSDPTDWRLDDSSITRETMHYACCEEPYYDARVMLRVSRQAPLYTWLIKVPAACLILLTMVVFVMPPGAGEKITFGGICVLLNLVFLVFTNDTVRSAPTHTPLLVQLVAVQLAMTAASVVVASWVVRASQGPYLSPPSSGIHRLSLAAAYVFGLFGYVRQTSNKGDMEKDSEGKDDKGGEHTEIKHQWLLVGAVLDRTILSLYLVVTLIMFVRFFCMI